MMQYAWKSGTRYKVDASVAANALEELRDDEGGLDPEDIVKAAKRKRHPLHNEFEWDEIKAAHQYRVSQARGMIRHLVVVYPEAPGVKTRRFELVTRPPKTKGEKPRRVYASSDDILKDPEARAELLNQAFAQLRAFQARFRGLQELAPVFRAISESLEVQT